MPSPLNTSGSVKTLHYNSGCTKPNQMTPISLTPAPLPQLTQDGQEECDSDLLISSCLFA